MYCEDTRTPFYRCNGPHQTPCSPARLTRRSPSGTVIAVRAYANWQNTQVLLTAALWHETNLRCLRAVLMIVRQFCGMYAANSLLPLSTMITKFVQWLWVTRATICSPLASTTSYGRFGLHFDQFCIYFSYFPLAQLWIQTIWYTGRWFNDTRSSARRTRGHRHWAGHEPG